MIPKQSYEVLRSKFRGCLLGSLLGDCLGAPFEGDVISSGDKLVIKNYLDKLLVPDFKGEFLTFSNFEDSFEFFKVLLNSIQMIRQ